MLFTCYTSAGFRIEAFTHTHNKKSSRDSTEHISETIETNLKNIEPEINK